MLATATFLWADLNDVIELDALLLTLFTLFTLLGLTASRRCRQSAIFCGLSALAGLAALLWRIVTLKSDFWRRFVADFWQSCCSC